MFKTRITEVLGIEYPIIQGGMARLARPDLASAVSNAGGLGTITSGDCPTVEKLREEIRQTKSLTDKPFSDNITLGLARSATPEQAASGRAQKRAYIEAAIAEGVKVFEVAGGNPEPYMKLFKDAGAKVIDKVGRPEDTKIAESVGVDAIIVVGFEAGGHIGIDSVSSLVFIPTAVDSVKIPVIAAGGIGDARGFVAALALGAEGVLMGTRFALSKDCGKFPEESKQRYLEALSNETVLVDHGTKVPWRVLPIVKGDPSTGHSCGQVIGLIHSIPSAKEIIDGIISEASLLTRRLCQNN